ncbi:MAG: glycosyltransferase family 9 protein [Campylobacterales bacterium]|nr:glycosyltransferase family 9 protein [Campylobacterales bacterium]
MLKKLFKYFIKKHSHKEQNLEKYNIEVAKKVFFAVFSRYGDGIISFKVICEFTRLYPRKQYLLFTTTQLVPYAKEILGDSVAVFGINKRNPFSLVPALLKLKAFDADIGFNPWSHGDDAEFFASFAKKYSVFKRFKQWDKTYNLYARVREYLSLDAKMLSNVALHLPVDAKNIVLVPFSTDVTKSLDKEMTKQLIVKLKELYKDAKITVCGFKNELKDIDGLEKFYFSKSSSDEFLKLLKSSDLFVGVDAGPLHIANTMGIKTIGIFGPTAPETIVDFDWSIIAIRDARLNGVFCCFYTCEYPSCIQSVVMNFNFVNIIYEIHKENNYCSLDLN